MLVNQAEREQAELRLARLEADERDLRVEADAVERLRSQWSEWAEIRDVAREQSERHVDALLVIPTSLTLARQILRKVLLAPISVTPSAAGSAWCYFGEAAYDGGLRGSVGRSGLSIVVPPPISGGSDASFSEVRGPEMSPHTPRR